MKKYLFFACSILLILLIGFTFLSDGSFQEKKTNIIQQANNYDVSKLMILKNSPMKSLKNDYEISVFSPDTLHYTDSFLFEDSQMKTLGLGSYIYYGDIESLPIKDLGEKFEKIVFKDVEAYYNHNEIYNEDLNNYYVSEELYFLKDKIKYLVTWSYVYDGKDKNKIDFFQYLDENLVSLTK